MASRHATIRDVARRAGVSVTTVSYVFNDRPGISEATRARVLQAAEALHYSPNALIRSLQQRRTNTIGIYMWSLGEDPSRHITAELFKGVSTELARTEYDLLVYSHRPGRFDAANVTAFLDKRVDGLIWTPAPVAFGALDTLASAELPTVAVLYDPVPAGIGQVSVDNRSGALAAVRHLVSLGHRRIACSGTSRLSDFIQRREGYRAALREAGIEPDPALEFLPTNGWALASETLPRARERGATAVFCMSDSHALNYLAAARKQGVSIPGDLSLVGFDDVPAAALVSPGLTTVRLPAAQVGELAVSHVISLIGGAAAAQAHTEVPTELIVRASTGPAPQS